MEQRISLITLGVTNLERARVFYERLGWRSQEVEESPFPDGRERAHPVGTRQAGRR
jgi:catechol 2,3-dioxygenase-like lactoylglutathione lyase family enzyme